MRAIQQSDLNSFIRLAFKAKIGITSLPKNEERLRKILAKSVESFQKDNDIVSNEIYLFVLEDTSTKTICGVSGIYSLTGRDHPIHYFKIVSLPLKKAFPETPDSIEVLEPVHYANGPTEICSLFLDPVYRKSGLGKLLSFSRFLYMANFPKKFTELVFALMRSYINDDDENPFWNNVGRKFLDISFKTLINRMDAGENVYPEQLSKFSILMPFLSDEAKMAIGNVYQNTIPALKMLKEQGFAYDGEIDAIDGGPKIVARRENIKAIKSSQTIQVNEIVEFSSEQNFLISNCTPNFRSCLGALKPEGILKKETAELLEVKKGDLIRYVEI